MAMNDRWNVRPGQEAAARLLASAIAHGRLAHAYLFVGPPESGPSVLALKLAQVLNCEHDVERPCQRCASCRRISAGNFAGLVTIVPEQGTLRLAQVRQLQHTLSLRRHEGRYRVCVIEQAEAMSLEAANSLLKLLEDPPDHTVLVLTTSHPDGLTETIRSRCQRLRLTSPPPEFVAAELMASGQLTREEAEQLARIGQDSPAVVRAHELGTSVTELAQSVARDLLGIRDTDPLELAERWEARGKEAVGLALELAIDLLRGAILLSTGCLDRPPAGAGAARALEQRASGPGLAAAIRALVRTKDYVERTVNTRLALDCMFLELREVIGSA